MKDIPIIFSAPMVRALLDGRKTMTRRLAWNGKKAADGEGFCQSPWRKTKPGDRLWVRESAMPAIDAGGADWRYAADYDPDGVKYMSKLQRWTPSIHMPRVASRITLIVTETKIERLQDISEIDAIAEGWERAAFEAAAEVHHDAARDWFSDLWESLHGIEAWKTNPEVVALTFRVVKANIDAPEAMAA